MEWTRLLDYTGLTENVLSYVAALYSRFNRLSIVEVKGRMQFYKLQVSWLWLNPGELELGPVADLGGVPWVPWNPPFEELPSFNSQCA